uniref:Uncharacterized protein n=1 Tax=Timema poppense TaxID=170557 RepID=A0A7R9H790_TIMPO|nr:unnamed protein product [Timema poppensis]
MPNIRLNIGGLIVAIAVENCNLHKRIALSIILLTGTSPMRLMFGFMITTMVLSMWISNTATTAMMVPIVQAVLDELKAHTDFENGRRVSQLTTLNTADSDQASGIFDPETRRKSLCRTGDLDTMTRPDSETICYYLGIAYASNLGGAGTLTGTGTNLTFKGLWDSSTTNNHKPTCGHRIFQIKTIGITITAISSLYTKYVSEVYVVNTRSLVAVTVSTGAVPPQPRSACTPVLHQRAGVPLSRSQSLDLFILPLLHLTPQPVPCFLHTPHSSALASQAISNTALSSQHHRSLFPHADGVNFASWMLFNVPLMLVNVFASWLWLQFLFMGLFRGKKARPNFNKDQALLVKDMVRERVKELGAMSFDEGCTLALFIAVVLLWFFREPEFISGWADIIPGVEIKDATPVMLVVMLLFILPSNLSFLNYFNSNGKYKFNQ